MTYRESLDYIDSLAKRGWRLGLDRMQAFCEAAYLTDALGSGQPKYIHVAGTNGKGSVTEYVQRILTEAGPRTGGYFSPYVFDITERIQVGCEPISEEDFANVASQLRPVADSFDESEFGAITEFEFKTAMGFLHWKQERCDWVALEVGMGGRLDATNVVTPTVSVIVSIGLDHTEFLGTTLREIAREKGGIIKEGRSVVIGEMPQEASGELRRIAAERGADILEVSDNTGAHGIRLGIRGARQMHNLALAKAAINAAGIAVTEEQVTKGAAAAWLPGRFQVEHTRGRRFILDGAHNAEAAAVLAESVREILLTGEEVVLLTGMLSGHDPASFYAPLMPLVSAVHVSPIDFHRAIKPLEVANALRTATCPVEAHQSVQQAIEAAVASSSPNDLILVTGSFYLVGEVGRELGISGTKPRSPLP